LKVGVDAKKTFDKINQDLFNINRLPDENPSKNTSEPFRGNGCQDGPSGSLSAKLPATSAKSSSPMVEPAVLRQCKAHSEFFEEEYRASTPISASGWILVFF